MKSYIKLHKMEKIYIHKTTKTHVQEYNTIRQLKVNSEILPLFQLMHRSA